MGFRQKKLKDFMKYLLYTVLLLFPLALFSQPASSIDFGGGLGVSSYYGDINQEGVFYEPHLSIEGFMRYNFNKRYALRAHVLSTKLKGRDRDFESPYQKIRSKFFVRSIIEVGVVGEVNFFPYQNPPEWGTSVGTVYGLLGFANSSSYSARRNNVGILSVLMGVGYKRALGNRWAVELEWAFRKCLNDDLDEIIDPINSGEQSKLFNNDWYNVLAVKLSYNLWRQSGKCRTFERDSDI